MRGAKTADDSTRNLNLNSNELEGLDNLEEDSRAAALLGLHTSEEADDSRISPAADEWREDSGAGGYFYPTGRRGSDTNNELEGIENDLQDMDAELVKLTELTSRTDSSLPSSDNQQDTEGQEEGANQEDVDRRSIYVGNVDYGATPHELQEHFRSCGVINRITIMVDRFSGHPKGYAYVEFADPEAVQNAVILSETVFRGRQIKVVQKRKNIPGFLAQPQHNPRGGSVSFRGRGRGRFPRGMPSAPGFGRGFPYGFYPRGYGPRFRGFRGSHGYSPY